MMEVTGTDQSGVPICPTNDTGILRELRNRKINKMQKSKGEYS